MVISLLFKQVPWWRCWKPPAVNGLQRLLQLVALPPSVFISLTPAVELMRSLTTACWGRAVMRSSLQWSSASSGTVAGSRPCESRPQRGSSGWHQGSARGWRWKAALLLSIRTNGGRQWESISWKRHFVPQIILPNMIPQLTCCWWLLTTHCLLGSFWGFLTHILNIIVVSTFNKPINKNKCDIIFAMFLHPFPLWFVDTVELWNFEKKKKVSFMHSKKFYSKKEKEKKRPIFSTLLESCQT